MLTILQYLVIASSVWAGVEVARCAFFPRRIRVSLMTGIIYFSAVYVADFFNLPMVLKAWLLRCGLIVLFVTFAIVARMVRRAGWSFPHEH